MNNTFELTVRELRNGGTAEELEKALINLVAQVRATGRSGELTLKLKIKPASKGDVNVLMLEDDIKVKYPQLERGGSIFFADDHQKLYRSDPRQRELELKTVEIPQESLRAVNSARAE